MNFIVSKVTTLPDGYEGYDLWKCGNRRCYGRGDGGKGRVDGVCQARYGLGVQRRYGDKILKLRREVLCTEELLKYLLAPRR